MSSWTLATWLGSIASNPGENATISLENIDPKQKGGKIYSYPSPSLFPNTLWMNRCLCHKGWLGRVGFKHRNQWPFKFCKGFAPEQVALSPLLGGHVFTIEEVVTAELSFACSLTRIFLKALKQTCQKIDQSDWFMVWHIWDFFKFNFPMLNWLWETPSRGMTFLVWTFKNCSKRHSAGYTTENQHGTQKFLVCTCFSASKGPFLRFHFFFPGCRP